MGPSLADIDKPDAEVFKITYSGIPDGGMPAFGETLGKDRVWKVVTYLKHQQER
jgi:cytochrome c oxidase cbb3-type subunit 2